jgi:hypothetical protein
MTFPLSSVTTSRSFVATLLLAQIARHGGRFLPRGLVVGKFLALGIAGSGSVQMKEISRHGANPTS